MQTSKPQALLVQTAATQIGQQAFLGVSLGVGFRLSDPRILCHEASVWAALSQQQQSVSLNEAALPKQHAEWLLVGHAVQTLSQQPAGTLVEWPCSADLAGVKKQLRCRLKVPTLADGNTPHALRLMVDHRNAWCGAAQENPCGTPQQAAAHLLLHSANGTAPAPLAATGALDMRWPPRAHHVPAVYSSPAEAASDGSHMGWPAHTDRRYFQQASSDQWLQSAQWPLGAAYTLRGFGPNGSGYAHSLPKLCAHAAWKEHGDETFNTIAFAQQSVWFLPDSDMGVMWWHGQIELHFLLEDRIEHLVAGVRGASESLSLAALASVAQKRANTKTRDVACESDLLLMPQLSDGWTWEQIETADEHPNEAPPTKTYETLCARVAAQEEFLQEVAREHQAQQTTLSEAPQPGPAEPFALAAEPDLWRDKLAAMTNPVLRNVRLEGQNLRDLRLNGWTLENVVFKHCAMDQCCIEDSKWKNVRIEQCSLSAAQFSHLHWNQGTLESSQTDHMAWNSVQLDDISLVACDLTATQVHKGQWKGVRLLDVYGEQGQVRAVQWEGCSMQDSDLPDWQWQQLDTSMLLLSASKLPGLNVQHCRLDRLSAIDVNLCASHWQVCLFNVAVFDKKTDLSDGVILDCQFKQCCANGLQAARVRVEHCDFSEFNASKLQATQSHWLACTLNNAQLSQANLREAAFESCSLKEARMFGADLTRSLVHNCNLIDAQTSWALAGNPEHWHSNLTAGHVDMPRRKA
jgi:uncharacterized protein YjbI with pentapeptide repeats